MLNKLLDFMKKHGSSDLFLSPGVSPKMRINGELVEVPKIGILNDDTIREMLFSSMKDYQKEDYLDNKELDYSLLIPSGARFRANAFFTIAGSCAVFREIPTDILTLEQLNAPSQIKKFGHLKKGLIVVTGPTGSGKSTTLAALIDYINSNFSHHIITVEDPVEFVHKSKKSLINQREIGSSTDSFANALKSALREDPDVILVGEMRDVETVHLALTAAETGHLVFGTLHTTSAAATITRIIDVFPAEEQKTVLGMLSASLKGVIAQRLLKKEGGGRCGAFEILIANSSVKNLIREDKIPQINSIMEINKKIGMVTMKNAIMELLDKGVISEDVARDNLVGLDV